jgi:acyl-CoA thioester hydrolase
MEQNCFSIEMAVRDYECDMQGVVNNAVYQNYLEHARHEFLKSIGIDFADFTARGINMVVTRVEIDYRLSLKSGDRFVVEVSPQRLSPLRIGFRQRIARQPDNKTAVQALVTGTALSATGRPRIPEELDALLRRG